MSKKTKKSPRQCPPTVTTDVPNPENQKSVIGSSDKPVQIGSYRIRFVFDDISFVRDAAKKRAAGGE
jgi:hypothetical protein